MNLGSGVGASFWFIGGVRSGLTWEHPRPSARRGRCTAAVAFRGAAPQAIDPVDVDDFDPLTIRQALRCRACGMQGVIRGGRWLPI